MSRSDNTQPYWMRAEWYEPIHRCIEHGSGYRNRTEHCDLPNNPHRSRPVRFTWKTTKEQRPTCWWEQMRYWGEYRFYDHAPKWFRQHIWSGSQRALVRNQLIRARQEYNGSGDTDVVPSTAQHRHCAAWLYW
jgi:hypothetical protein